MAGKIKCACGKQYAWKPDLAGKRAKCKCGNVVRFPQFDPDDPELVDEVPTYEVTESGERVYRHEARSKPFEPTVGDETTINAIVKHVERHIGPPDNVFHELISDLVHVDIHVVNPTPERNWHTLVTSGMSERPMTIPDDPELEEFKFAELLICLPPDWPMDQEAWADPSNFWPIQWLKMMARMPHEYDTWLGAGHTVPNGDPPEPFAPNTKLCCMLLLPPMLVGEEFHQLKMGRAKTINFYAMVPIYREEMDFKLKHDVNALLEKFAEAEVSELLDVERKNTCKKKFGLF
jgi:Suppressor of fused protein (SUFU)